MEPKQNISLGLPGAIIIAGAIVALAIIWVHKPAGTGGAAANSSAPATAQVNMGPVSSADHILGNPAAPVKLVEYSDPSCPYCKMFNPAMEQLMGDYGPTGNVAWIYRQFPLDQSDQNGNVLHPLAGTQAEALECAAALGGNTAFWAYEKDWFSTFPQDGADETVAVDNQQIAQVGKDVGLDPASFSDCISSDRFKDKIASEYADGINAGVSGTPYLVIIAPDGTKIPLAGAQSYDTLKTAIDAMLPSNSAASTTSTAGN